MSTLLGCVIGEHCCIVNCGVVKCSESFVTPYSNDYGLNEFVLI